MVFVKSSVQKSGLVLDGVLGEKKPKLFLEHFSSGDES